MDTSINTLWFDVAVSTSIFALGIIFFGHFEDHKPKLQRAAKVVLFTLFFAGISYTFGRTVAYSLLGALSLFVVYVHAILLPKNGINGLTGEPRERYEEWRGINRNKA